MAIQAPGCSEDLVSVLAATSGRRIRGLVGPADQVERGRSALPPGGGAAAVDRVERLYRLELSELRTPAALQAGRLRCRLPEEFHRETLVEWGVAYDVETLGAREDAALWENNRASLARLLTRNSQWLLQAGSVPVSMSAFSSSVPDCVQIGGVYTPPPLRGRGYARAVVAGSLLVARARGARTSVLFTPRDNLAAHRAYESLGYRQVGQFGILLLAPAPGDPS